MPRDVVVIDLGWNKAKAAAKLIGGAGVKVGVRAGPAQDGVQVVDYAAMNEFGTEDIPARPWMRHTADTQENNARAYVRRLVPPLIDGSMTVDQVLSAVGMWYRDRLQNTIRHSKSWAEPNAPSTIALKGSSTPLVDHGVLINSIDYEITRGRG
jgi:hypothetical protein